MAGPARRPRQGNYRRPLCNLAIGGHEPANDACPCNAILGKISRSLSLCDRPVSYTHLTLPTNRTGEEIFDQRGPMISGQIFSSAMAELPPPCLRAKGRMTLETDRPALGAARNCGRPRWDSIHWLSTWLLCRFLSDILLYLAYCDVGVKRTERIYASHFRYACGFAALV